MILENYILRSAIISIVLIGFYHLVLRNDTNYRAIRYFFLSGLTLTLFLPLAEITYQITIPYIPKSINEAYVPMEVDAIPFVVADTVIETSQQPEITLTQVLNWIYVIGIVLFSVRLLIQMFLIARRYIQSEKIEWRDVKVCIHESIKSPYVLGNRIFVNNRSYFNDDKMEVLTHERIHLKQNHWIDMLLNEMVTMLFWFNPLVWYYGRLMKQNLEFIADRGVLDSGIEMNTYLKSIICETMGAEAIVLANHFRDSRNKKRLKMMKKVKNSKWRPLKMLLLLPAIALMLWAFSKPEYVMEVQSGNSETDEKSDSSFICNGTVTDWVLADTMDIIDEKTKKIERKIIQEVATPISQALIKNSRTGKEVLTNNTGEFSITVKNGDLLTISKEGFITSQKKIGNIETLNAELKRIKNMKTILTKGIVFINDTIEITDKKTGIVTQKIVTGGLPGVCVSLTSSGDRRIKNGTITDKGGNFEIEANEGDELNFSFVGYQTEKVGVVDGKRITLAMKEETMLIDPGKYREKYKGKNILPPPPPPPPPAIKKIKGDIKPPPPPPPPPPSVDTKDEEPIFFIVEEMPHYFGGLEYFWHKLYSMANVKSKKGYKGTVKVKFQVTSKGEVKYVKALTNTDTKEAKAAEEIVARLQDWKPGRQRGKAVSCWFVVEVEF